MPCGCELELSFAIYLRDYAGISIFGLITRGMTQTHASLGKTCLKSIYVTDFGQFLLPFEFQSTCGGGLVPENVLVLDDKA